MSEVEGRGETRGQASAPGLAIAAPNRHNRAVTDPDAKPRLLARLRGKLFHTWFLLTRPMTLGVRAIVLDAQDRVFLVRHTYVPGWHLPGGGVEHGETMLAALRKELREEGAIALTGPPRLMGLYHATQWTRRDHVALYVVRDFAQSGPRLPDREIAEAGFFARDALPDGVAKATLRRLAELDGAPASESW
jgi:ADP-ribose pyrophosphatase YjhB (NUDIX family)